MKYYYCDTCSLISLFQEKCLEHLSQYKEQFFISETQLISEIKYPDKLIKQVKESITIIIESDEVIQKYDIQ